MDANLTPINAQRAVDVASRSPMTRLALMPARAKMMLGLGAAGLVAVAVALLLWSQSANLAPLYPNRMPSAEAAPVLDQLRQMGVSPKVLDDGVIMVPAGQVAELRMKLSQAGLPKSSPTGFALMDNARFGQSQLQERTQLQRALGDEIATSISKLAAVESARVLLALPAQNGFSLSVQTSNIEGWSYDGVDTTLLVIASDRMGNPVPRQRPDARVQQHFPARTRRRIARDDRVNVRDQAKWHCPILVPPSPLQSKRGSSGPMTSSSASRQIERVGAAFRSRLRRSIAATSRSIPRWERSARGAR